MRFKNIILSKTMQGHPQMENQRRRDQITVKQTENTSITRTSLSS